MLSVPLSPAAAAFTEGASQTALQRISSQSGREKKGGSGAAAKSAQAPQATEQVQDNAGDQLPAAGQTQAAPQATAAGSKRKAHDAADDQQRQVQLVSLQCIVGCMKSLEQTLPLQSQVLDKQQSSYEVLCWSLT